MDVPEIRAIVALYLCRHTRRRVIRHDLAVCTRVCKDWHATFMPLLYRSITLTIRSTTIFCEGRTAPSPKVLQANSHLIQELKLDLFSTQSLACHQTVATLRSLKKLNLSAHTERGYGPDWIDWLSLRPLLLNNRGIQELCIDRIRHSNCLWHIAEDCSSHLTTLRLRDMKFDWTQLLPVLTNCRQLRKLECDTCTFNGSEEQFMEVAATCRPAATNITNLEVTNSSGKGKVSLVDWIKICPRLETLSVTSDNTIQIGPILQFSPGPQLSRLSLDCERLEDAELAEVLTRCTSLIDLSLDSATVSRQVFAALSGHFGSLISLDLSSELVDEQWMVKGIFENCPRLKGLFLYAVDVDNLYNTSLDGEEDLPWTCRDSLKELCILQIQVSFDTTVNDRFMKQLMDLKQLVQLATEAIFRWDGTTRIFEPRNVHGDTLETRLLDRLLECKHWELSSYDLQQDPKWWLVRDAWPKLMSFFYNGAFYDSDSS